MSEKASKTVRAALNTRSRCWSRPCRVEVGKVMPRKRPVSVHRSRSILASWMAPLWRAQLIAEMTFSTSMESLLFIAVWHDQITLLLVR